MKGLSKGFWAVSVVFLGVCFLLGAGPGLTKAVAEDKVYDNKDVGFSVSYPSDWLDDKLLTGEVLRVHKPNEYKIPVLTVSITDMKEGTKLEEAPDAWVASVKAANPGTDRYKVSDKEMFKLADGTPAYAYIVKWNWSDGVTKLFSTVVTSFKGKKSISVTATNVMGGETPADVLMKMCRTLKFH
ncbi:MAG: hypothetical protein KKB20_23730 [Proteobacteria bacterium]|nr:hypothetical protein [Pseudomonadota bacterium]